MPEVTIKYSWWQSFQPNWWFSPETITLPDLCTLCSCNSVVSRRCCYLLLPHCHPHWESTDKRSSSCHKKWDYKSLWPKFLLNDGATGENISDTLIKKKEFWGYSRNTGQWWHGYYGIIENNYQCLSSLHLSAINLQYLRQYLRPSIDGRSQWRYSQHFRWCTLPHYRHPALAAASLRGKCSVKWASCGT